MAILYFIDYGPVAELNPRLAQVLQKAQKNNLPPEYIAFASRISCVRIIF